MFLTVPQVSNHNGAALAVVTKRPVFDTPMFEGVVCRVCAREHRTFFVFSSVHTVVETVYEKNRFIFYGKYRQRRRLIIYIFDHMVYIRGIVARG